MVILGYLTIRPVTICDILPLTGCEEIKKYTCVGQCVHVHGRQRVKIVQQRNNMILTLLNSLLKVGLCYKLNKMTAK